MGGLPWGGSEELWSRAAQVLLDRGHEVAFCSRRWHPTAAPLERLIERGAVPTFRPRMRLGRSLRRALESLRLIQLRYVNWLRKTRPDLVVISFSCHTDDPHIANTCHMLGIPYAILLQSAGYHNWLHPKSIPDFTSAYRNARQCYFVSQRNREVMEANLAIDLSGAEIVDNPFQVSVDAAPGWPSHEPHWKLACVARVHFLTKSQDVLLRALRSAKWRSRPFQLVCWGSDDGSLGTLEKLIDLYGLRGQVSYGGFATDITELWSKHHALVLPSRAEGNPLALVEAMLCGRVPIVTDIGRSAELIDDNKSGFIAAAATVELIDEVLERAWQQRHRWHEIGQHAAAAIRQRHSLRPGEDFADRILSLAAPHKATHQMAA
jgi:glycosyltransferase involved in cell wall biosynthesis